MSKRQKSLFAADFSAVAKSQKMLFASISFGQKSTNFLPKFVSKSKICSRNSRISTFDCRYNDYRMSKRQKAFSRLIFQPLQKAKNCFLLLYHCNRNRQIPLGNLLANLWFAVEILWISTFDCRYIRLRGGKRRFFLKSAYPLCQNNEAVSNFAFETASSFYFYPC